MPSFKKLCPSKLKEFKLPSRVIVGGATLASAYPLDLAQRDLEKSLNIKQRSKTKMLRQISNPAILGTVVGVDEAADSENKN
jgi:hypothetical protein